MPWGSAQLLFRLPLLLFLELPIACLRFLARFVGFLVLALSVFLTAAVRKAFRLIAGGSGRVSGVVVRGFDWGLERLRESYLGLLGGALERQGLVVLATALVAVFSFQLASRIPNELIPEVHQGEFTIDIDLPRATRIEETDRVIRPWEKRLLSTETPGIASLTTTVGVEKDDVNAGDRGEHSAQILVRLDRSDHPQALEERVKSLIRGLLRDAEFESVEFRNPVLFSFRTPIEVEVKGYHLERLRAIVGEIERRMQEIPEIEDVKTNLARGHPEVQIELDREELSRLNLSLGQVGNVIRQKVQGEVPTFFTFGDRKVPIRVRLKETHRDSLEELENLVVNPGAEREYRLADVVRLGDGEGRGLPIGEGPAEIRRISHQRAGVVTANLADMSLGAATEKVAQVIREVEHPPDFTVGFGGQKEEMDVATSSLRRALLLAIFLVYVVMAMQFESLVQPFVIIVAIPLAMVGVFPVLWWLEIPLSIIVFIGMIVLAGIVVNNAIVLVDTANQLRQSGMPLRESLVRAGELRLRPILMTTLTTVLGLLPLTGTFSGLGLFEAVLGTGEGAEIRAPLAITVIAGLLASTVLTLVVVPVLAQITYSAVAWSRGFGRLPNTEAPDNAD